MENNSEEYNFKELSKKLYPYFIPEIELTKEDKLFQKIIENYSFSKNSLRVSNHWTDKINNDQLSILDMELRAKKINTHFGYIYFSTPIIEKPSMTPRMARYGRYTYSGELKCTLNFVSNRDVEENFTYPISLGFIPIPLRSKFCHLYGKTDKELLEMGENPVDPFSYFIIYGTEITIVTQEKLRSQEFLFFYNNKGLLEGRFTSVSFSGSSLLIMNVGKTWPCIKIKMKHITKNKHIPLFILFKFLGYNIDEAKELILSYVKDENRILVEYGLQTSISKAKFYKDYVSFWAIKRELKTSNTKEILKLMIDEINRDCFSELETIPTTPQMLEEYIKKYIGSDYTPVQVKQLEKAKHLAYMTARMVEIMQGIRKIDDRNTWSNKKLEIGAKSYEQLFINMFDDIIKTSQEDIDKIFGKKDGLKISTLEKITEANITSLIKIKGSIITDSSEKSFNANSWGHKGAHRKENITDTLKRETLLSIYSQNDKINTPANRNAPRIIREVRGSQVRRLCLAETPEGTNCGLVNHFAMTLYISLERSQQSFLDLLIKYKNFISNEKTDKHSYCLLINGKIHSWCNKELVTYIRNERRNNKLPLDSAIVLNEINNSVEYYCNSSRPCAPLLIVDENGELLIDKKKLWNESLEKLYEEGVIELLDIKEEESSLAVVAQYPKDVRNKKNKINELTKKNNDLKKNRNINDDEYVILVDLYRKIYSKDTLSSIILVLKELIEKNISFDNISKFKLTIVDQDKLKSLTILDKYFLKANNYTTIFSQLNKLHDNYESIIEEIENDISLHELKNKKKYTHSEINPVSAFGISCGLIPDGSSNPGPRITYQGSMGKQALQNDPIHYDRMTDAGRKISSTSTRSIWETVIHEPGGFNIIPSGQTIPVAFCADPYNMEDAQVYNDEFLNSYNFEVTKYATYSATRTTNRYVVEEFKKPINSNPSKFEAIGDDGIPIVGKFVKADDCIIGKVRKISASDTSEEKIENASVFVGVGEDGYIERVLITVNEKNEIMILVKTGILRKYIVGDKAASRYSQKGTMGKKRSGIDMIRVASGVNKGVIPAMVINPCSIPSRMTIAMLKEMLTSKAALYSLERINATCYNGIDVEKFQKILIENGMNEYGNEEMCHPNGEKLKCPVFFGPCTYQALKHHVKDKIQLRDRGNIRLISHQPVSGRANKGGLKIGEMERDAMIELGASSLLTERLMGVSDEYKTVYCSNCGNIAESDVLSHKQNPNTCRFCLPNEARFGTFKSPYIYLLIYRMLNAIGINCVLGLESEVQQGDYIENKYVV